MAADPKALQKHAETAEKSLEALATGLAQAGAAEQIVQTVTKMADVTRKVASTLSDVRGEGPPEGAPPEEAPPEGAPPEEAPPEQPRTIGGAARELGSEVAAKAAKRRAQGTY